MRKTTTIFIICLAFIVFNSCGKKDNSEAIPYVYVNFAIYPNTIDYIADGQWAYVTGGYKGIIIYRYQSDEFLAFERACPYDPLLQGARVQVESSGLIAVDSLCGSRFLLLDGSPVKGPAGTSLKQYHTRYDGLVLEVFN